MAASASSAAPSDSMSAHAPENPRFELVKWNAVALWRWNVEVDSCAICRSHIMERCVDCQTANKVGECSTAWGTCNHAFHYHCIQRWLRTRQVCPLDSQPWELQRLN